MSTFDQQATRRGQVLVLFVGGLIALLLGLALVIDGGNVMAQQRDDPERGRRRR